MTRLTHTIEIQRPLKEVYGLAREVEKYPTFLPGYVKSLIVQRQNDGALLERSAWVQGKLVQWKSWVRWKENESIHFLQKEGPLKGMWVDWRFVELSPNSTRLTITHLFTVRRPWGLGAIVERWVFKPRLNTIAGQVIAAFKLACENRWMVPI